jgi:predicted membrane-bound mannosyltransferase
VATLAATAHAAFPGEPIRVISDEYWPLPWYLRREAMVGYWTTPPEVCDGALIIASAAQADAVRARLKARYRETFIGLRPGVICAVFVREP